jgi:CheY-like chemotaxis protein
VHTLPISILLVEDNPDHVYLVQEALESRAMLNLAAVAGDGVTALELVRQRTGGDSPFDMILLDINIPRKSGFDVLDELKSDERQKHIPVVMLSTSDREDDIRKSYRKGAASYICKPSGFAEFENIFAVFESYWHKVSVLPHVAQPRTDKNPS